MHGREPKHIKPQTQPPIRRAGFSPASQDPTHGCEPKNINTKTHPQSVVPDSFRHLRTQRTAVNPNTATPKPNSPICRAGFSPAPQEPMHACELKQI